MFERIQVLERPLGELVNALRLEMERVGRELEGEAYEEQPAISAEVEEVEEVEMPEWAREAVAAGGAEAEVPAEPAQPTMVSPLPQPTGEPHEKKKTKRRMFRRKGSTAKGAFITTQGHCAVCQRTFMAGSEEAFKLSGWRANGDVGLCPDCQAQSWQLPDGARLPFRRGGA